MSKVRGTFKQFEGSIEVADDLLSSTAEATIHLSSVDTGTPQRDDHLRSSDFFDAATQPTMTYRSTCAAPDGDGFVAIGDLTVKGVTRQVELAVELLGVGTDAYGNERVGLEATGQISRKDFGIDFNIPLDGGKLLIGDAVTHLADRAGRARQPPDPLPPIRPSCAPPAVPRARLAQGSDERREGSGEALEHQRHALAAADAHGDQPDLLVVPGSELSIVACSRAPVMPNGCPTAIAPPLTLSRSRSIPRSLVRRHHLGGERLVDLHQVDVVDAHPGPGERLPRRLDRTRGP